MSPETDARSWVMKLAAVIHDEVCCTNPKLAAALTDFMETAEPSQEDKP